MYRRSNNFKLPNKRNVRYGTYTVTGLAEGVTMLENALLKMIFEFKDGYALMRVSSKQYLSGTYTIVLINIQTLKMLFETQQLNPYT